MGTKAKIIILLLLLTGAFLAGRFLMPPEVEVVEKLVEKEGKTIEKIRIVTEKPDGTKVTREESKTVSTKTTARDSQVTPVKNNWSAGVALTPKIDPTLQDVEAFVSRRVGGDVWIYTNVKIDKKPEVTLGVRYEF